MCTVYIVHCNTHIYYNKLSCVKCICRVYIVHMHSCKIYIIHHTYTYEIRWCVHSFHENKTYIHRTTYDVCTMYMRGMYGCDVRRTVYLYGVRNIRQHLYNNVRRACSADNKSHSARLQVTAAITSCMTSRYCAIVLVYPWRP